MTKTADLIVEKLLLLEQELKDQSFWQLVAPTDKALSSDMPFCADTMPLDQWIQWVFVPRMRCLLEAHASLPAKSGVHVMAEHVYGDRQQKLVSLLKKIDALMTTAVA